MTTPVSIAGPNVAEVMVLSLQVAVPLRIDELARMRPYERELALGLWRAAAAEAVAHQGDAVQFPNHMDVRAAQVFNHFARGLAVLAHAPGGVRFAGIHWCLAHRGGRRVDSIDGPGCSPGWAPRGLL